MVPTEIQYLLDNYEAEDISLSITKADYSGEVPVLGLTVYKPGNELKNWTLEVIGHRASEISFSPDVEDDLILITNDHPLLWQFADVQSELYFNGSSNDINRVVSELNQIDFKLFGKYRKSSQQLYTLLQTTNGLLCKGPEKLLTKYEKCLNKYGIETSIVGGYIPTYWDGKNTCSGETLKLFLTRDSYIFGQDFIFTKRDQ
ncbi:hypothetical protein A4D02_34645 [Niastella koreensis]|uniref:Uncharacterized protein n=2 Tax=Niastella koreensis TaxID=354356 RepID=G8TRS1_NIAKG|nr:hypothetical protein [Niastella koreensis]AEW02218.1 hypothetical protein Niako_5990 [Niastella koreensis GR20-10]OQP45092.1 hypothetical protein A4D02_34645 [Niastella koreensis]